METRQYCQLTRYPKCWKRLFVPGVLEIKPTDCEKSVKLSGLAGKKRLIKVPFRRFFSLPDTRCAAMSWPSCWVGARSVVRVNGLTGNKLWMCVELS